MLGRSARTCFEEGNVEVLGLPGLASPGQGPPCCGSGVGSVPCSSLSLQTRQTLTRDPRLLYHQRGGGEERECSSQPAPEAKKEEGGTRSLLMGASSRSGTRGWQLFKPAALSPEPGPAGRPAGQSQGFLMDHWSLGRYSTCPLVTPQPEQVEGHCDR